MRVDEISLSTDADEYTFSFAAPCTVLDGPVGTGKSSLLELIKHALGGNAVLTPVIRKEVHSVRARLSLNGTSIIVQRALGRAGTSVEFRDPRDDGFIEQLSIRSRGDQASVSDRLLGLLGIPAVEIPRARTRATAASVPLTFNDLYAYVYVEQQDIDRSVVHHTEVFREPKRRAIFELLFGLADPQHLAMETELGRVRDGLRHAESRAAAVRTFLHTATDQDEESLRRRRLALGEKAEEAREGLERLRAEISASTSAHQTLRDEVLKAEEDAQEASEGAQAAETEVARREHLLAQMRVNLVREDKARIASRRLSPLEFVVCPRCTQALEEGRSSAGVCALCLQPDPLAGMEFETPLDDTDEQIAELDNLLSVAINDAERARDVARATNRRLAHLRQALDVATAEAVTPRFNEVELLSATRAQALADLDHIRNVLNFWDELKALDATVSALISERQRLEEALRRSRAKLEARRSVLGDLGDRFNETVVALQVPWAADGSIDHRTYLPLVNGERFESLAVAGGTKTIVTVAYHLALLGHALAEQDTLLPQMLILDTPRKNLGVNPSDKAMGTRIYERIRALVDAYQNKVQFIIAENDFLDEADWARSLHFDYDNPLLPHVVHPGEEAVKAGRLDTVETLRRR
nr:AAA family ATPase [Actinopolymorpha pittospori]